MLILDAHVHVYPFYDAPALLRGAVVRLAALGSPGDTLGIVLVEREGVDVFSEWLAGRRLPDGWTATSLDAMALRLVSPQGERLHVFAGRQIACAERLEILGVGCRTAVPDGVPCEEAIGAIVGDGGLPVLAWGLGKWLFGRAAAVRRLLSAHPGGELPLCDTSLRPVFWPRPSAMRDPARPVLYGSDPLPKAGEEAQAGRYAGVVDVEMSSSDPTARLLARLRAGGLRAVGRRNSPAELLRRH
jgi:hypothetical protein